MHRSRFRSLSLAVAASLALPASALAVPFTAGNIAVYRVGDGTAVAASSANKVFIDEYTPAGTLVQSIPAPTVGSGANHALLATSTSTSEGMLNRSSDGRYLVFAGYDAPLGTANLSATTSAVANRVVGRLDALGTVDTSTALTDAFNANNVRSATSSNGTDIWVSGSASLNNTGINYTTLGSTTSTNVINYATRDVAIYNNQLYAGSTANASTPTPIFQAGIGLPTTLATATGLPGLPAGGGGSTNQFVLLDLSNAIAGLDTMYVADDTGNALRKYSLVGGSWTQSGATIGAGADDYAGLTAIVNGGTVTLFGTRLSGASADQLFTLTDTNGYNAAFSSTTPTVIATAAANIEFRGVALVPVPEPSSVLLLACGALALLAIGRRKQFTA